MRMLTGFIGGFLICGLLALGAMSILPLRADTDEPSENVTDGLVTLLPDIEKIYEEALTTPFIKAESQIYDEDIAEFYSDLLDRTGILPAE